MLLLSWMFVISFVLFGGFFLAMIYYRHKCIKVQTDVDFWRGRLKSVREELVAAREQNNLLKDLRAKFHHHLLRELEKNGDK